MTTKKALLVGGKKMKMDFVLNYFRICLFALFEIQSFKLFRTKPLLIFMAFNNFLSSTIKVGKLFPCILKMRKEFTNSGF